ncbi:hypothetical protein V490_00148 [Pseudogymnoascus sp. VKM F-3557]|nr:hypothetical protein V490_00148 [Pseudogymnoascus sp. VKM F-3557]
MAPRQPKPNVQKVGRQPSAPKDHGKDLKVSRKDDHNYLLARNPSEFLTAENRKRKRLRESEGPLSGTQSKPVRKRPRTSASSSVIGNKSSQEAACNVTRHSINPIDHWRRESCWPEEYFKQDDHARKDISKAFEERWCEGYRVPEANMNHLLARQKSSSSLRKQSEASSAAPSSSDQKPREAKSATYARPSYEAVLASKGSFMGKFDLGITNASKGLCRTLLEAEQSVPRDTLFRDDLFEETCESVRARNEAMVVRDISPLICPSAQVLRVYGAKHLKTLNESVNEGWNSAIPFYGPRPQPDYSVGFGRSAFSDDQIKKLTPFVGEVTDTFASYFMATWQMYFPFLTCEVKCGAAALDVADRQNAHSMTIAVRSIVELFRLVKREKELHQEILAFSISHDHSSVRIYAHFPIIDGKQTTFYRHPIHKFDFTALDGKEKWTAYRFTKNVYDTWVPGHFKRICSVIDELPPDLNFEVLEQSELGESGLSQGLESHNLSRQSSHDAASLIETADSQSSRNLSRDITPDTSLSQGIERAFKKPKKRGRAVELHHC